MTTAQPPSADDSPTSTASTPSGQPVPTSQRPSTEPPATMRAALRREYGGVEQIHVETVAVPQPAEGQVLLAVRAGGLDRGALHLLTGTPYLARAAFGLRRPRQPVLGREVAGEVLALGPGVCGFAVGDRVFGTCEGSFAEYAVARADRLAPTPAALGDAQAAALAISGGTALLALRDQAQVRTGQAVLVIGASGGVGTFAVQLAAHLGADVTAVCSAGKADFVAGLGAHRVLDYRTTGITDDGRRYDAIIDIAGNRSLAELRRALTPTGALVIVGGEGGGDWFGGLQRNIAASLLNPLTRQRLAWFIASEASDLFATLADLAATGTLRPSIDRTVGLDGVAGAMAAMADGGLRGKVAVQPAPSR